MKRLRVEAQITGCQCACDHCLTYGKHTKEYMSLDEIELILNNMKEYSEIGHFFPLFDVTNHPEFIKILKLSNDYGYKRDTLSTNGVYEISDNELKFMKEFGIKDIQLAFHGLNETHDSFVHYKGVFKKLISLIKKASSQGFKFWNILFINNKNISEIIEVIRILKSLGISEKDFIVTTYMYQGRAMKLEELYFTRKQMKEVELIYPIIPRERYSESEWMNKVKRDDKWNKPAFQLQRDKLELHIDSNFDVYFQNMNPYYFKGIKKSKEGFKLGNLKLEKLNKIIQKAERERPPLIRLLENITIKELGKKLEKELEEKNDILYTHNDILYKWPYEFLKSVTNENSV
ncbi:MAG: radical SAM protein [Firmicutes bacterium]|nr:radical SAM protein [Bacillota bacterium]